MGIEARLQVWHLPASRLFSRYVLATCAVLAMSGCESLWMNHGKVISVLAAGQVGMFHLKEGHWPKDRADLIAHGCLRLDEATTVVASVDEDPPEPGCQFFVRLPYKLELQGRAGNLRMVLRDQSGNLVCQLVVIAPRASDKESLNPQIVLRTTLFGCPGEGKSLP